MIIIIILPVFIFLPNSIDKKSIKSIFYKLCTYTKWTTILILLIRLHP